MVIVQCTLYGIDYLSQSVFKSYITLLKRWHHSVASLPFYLFMTRQSTAWIDGSFLFLCLPFFCILCLYGLAHIIYRSIIVGTTPPFISSQKTGLAWLNVLRACPHSHLLFCSNFWSWYDCLAIVLLMAIFAHLSQLPQRIKSCSLWFSHYLLEILKATAYA